MNELGKENLIPEQEKMLPAITEHTTVGEEKTNSSLALLLIVFSIMFLACSVLAWCIHPKKDPEGVKFAPVSEMVSEEIVSVSDQMQDQEPEAKTTDQEKPDGAIESEAKKESTDTSWQKMFFGTSDPAVMPSTLKVTGLTDNEKNLIGFRESVYIQSAAGFFSNNGIRATAINFTGSVSVSASRACAYEAELTGAENFKLVTIFYPEIPGKYLFVLEEKKDSENSDRVNTSGLTIPQAQTGNVQPASSVSVGTDTGHAEPEYDAMRLSINQIPSELSNYVANVYELQYGLYDYLFQQGIKNATTATIDSHYIDGNERAATIEITVEGVGHVTAIYNRDENSYSFQ